MSNISCPIINSRRELNNLARKLENRTSVGVDLEADSMYHFKEKVCLIQIAAENVNAVIDPLAIDDLSALKPVFKRRDIQKVFHGADYDVRSLFRDFRISVHNLFDTELACRFLGFEETGLDAVVKKRFGVVLDKKYQRKDWSRRPLPAEMITYAAQDARFLVPMAQWLKGELKQKGRLDWVYEECEHLSQVRANNFDNHPLFLHFKGAGSLDQKTLAVLEALLQFRRQTARKKDKPLFRIIGNRSLLALAVDKPANLKQLEQTGILSKKQIGMYGPDVLAAVEAARKIAPKELPVYPRKKAPRIPAAVAGRIKILRDWRDDRAKKMTINPALLCTKALMTTLAVQKPLKVSDLAKVNELKRWQRKEFGREVVAVLKQVR
jgi:ribonuclease D